MALRKHMTFILDSLDGRQPDTYEVLDVNYTERQYTIRELRTLQKSVLTFDEAEQRHATMLNS